MASYVVKAALDSDSPAGLLSFDEKTMYRGKDVRPGDEVFVFASETQGGHGLCARGVVAAARRGPGIRVAIDVRITALASRRFGRAELKSFRGLEDGRPETEIDWKFYRQATNKIAGVSDAAAAFLGSFFSSTRD